MIIEEKVSFKTLFKSLIDLTMMQLKEKTNFSFKKNIKKTLFNLSFYLIGVALVTFISVLLITLAKKFNIFSFIGEFPVNVLVLFFSVIFFLSLIYVTITLVKSLYLSKDNFVLLTLPTTPSVVFTSKLLVNYVLEFKKNLLFVIPLFVGYGIVSNYDWYYYLWLLFLFLFISTIPILLGALLSIPTMYLYTVIKKTKVFQYVLYITFGLGTIGLVYYLISLIPKDINFIKTWGTTFFKIRDFLQTFDEAVYPLSKIVKLVVGNGTSNSIFTLTGLLIFLVLIASIVLLTYLCFVISKPLFYQMASKPFEYKKNMKAKINKEHKLNSFFAVLKKEWLLSFRNGELLTLVIELIVVMPLSIMLLNSIYNAMSTKYLGTQLTVCFNIFIILLLLLSSNITVASCYSRDGANSYLNKLQPSSCAMIIFGKLTVNIVVGIIGIIITLIIYGSFKAILDKELIYFGFIILFIYLGHLFKSAQMDITNPQTEQYSTFSDHINNPNENISIILVFLLSIIVAASWLLLSLENAQTPYIKILCVSVAYFLIEIIFYFLKIKVYYKEG